MSISGEERFLSPTLVHNHRWTEFAVVVSCSFLLFKRMGITNNLVWLMYYLIKWIPTAHERVSAFETEIKPYYTKCPWAIFWLQLYPNILNCHKKGHSISHFHYNHKIWNQINHIKCFKYMSLVSILTLRFAKFKFYSQFFIFYRSV